MQLDCPVCGERFEDRKKLNKHIQTKHRDEIKLTKLEHPHKETKASNRIK